jgi:hypothetical protein
MIQCGDCASSRKRVRANRPQRTIYTMLSPIAFLSFISTSVHRNEARFGNFIAQDEVILALRALASIAAHFSSWRCEAWGICVVGELSQDSENFECYVSGSIWGGKNHTMQYLPCILPSILVTEWYTQYLKQFRSTNCIGGIASTKGKHILYKPWQKYRVDCRYGAPCLCMAAKKVKYKLCRFKESLHPA